MDTVTNITKKELGDSEVELSGEIPTEVVQTHWGKAVKKLGENTEIPGFRKGHIPEKLLIERVGELSILHEVAEMVLQEAYPEIVRDEKLDVVGPPEVKITRLALQNPIGFSIKTAILPEITLPDYKKIAGEEFKHKEKATVEDSEVESVIERILQSSGPQERDKKNGTKKKGAKLTDTLVQKLGNFQSVEDFKKKLRENIQLDKERKLREQKRVIASEKIIKNSTMSLPRILIDSELEKMIAQFKGDVERMGFTYNNYLDQIKKTEEDVRSEWRKDAERRAKLQLVLNKIALIENIHPNEEAIKHEIGHVTQHIKDADPERARVYVTTLLTNEEVFRFLEREGEKLEKENGN